MEMIRKDVQEAVQWVAFDVQCDAPAAMIAAWGSEDITSAPVFLPPHF